jgi:multidrug efflux pump
MMLAFALVAASCCLSAESAEIRTGAGRGSRHVILGVFSGPDGATLDYTEKYARQIEQIYGDTKDIERYFVVSGNPTVSQGISFIGLTDWSERNRNSLRYRQGTVPEVHGRSRRPGFSGDAALAWPESARAADQFRHRHLGFL